jgi:hypothetical protein
MRHNVAKLKETPGNPPVRACQIIRVFRLKGRGAVYAFAQSVDFFRSVYLKLSRSRHGARVRNGEPRELSTGTTLAYFSQGSACAHVGQ